MIGDGTRTFTWDAENRLLSVTAGTHASEFTYDGFSRRVRIVEKDNGSTTSDKRFLWCGLSICEERDSTGATVTKRFFAQGVRETTGGGASFFYARDHLGSIRELVDSSNTLRARYDYDPWGRRTKLAGDKDADFGYTGHYEHAASGLTLAPYRAYDTNLGRWISEDPIGMAGGLNLSAYVANRSTSAIDPTGQFVMAIPFLIAAADAAWTGAVALATVATAWYISKGIADVATPLLNKDTKADRETTGREDRNLDKIERGSPDRKPSDYRPDPKDNVPPSDRPNPLEDLEDIGKSQAKRPDYIDDIGKAIQKAGKFVKDSCKK